jgi:hypothetical protein
MKDCFKCGVIKELSEFYKHKQMADGYLNKCKICSRKDVIKNRIKKIEHYREYDKSRMNEPQRVAAREKWANSEEGKNSQMLAKVRWAAKNPEKKSGANARWVDANPEKISAHNKVRAAIANGSLMKQPCEKCRNKKTHAHHYDYTKPLDVKWLCAQCHKDEHKKMPF